MLTLTLTGCAGLEVATKAMDIIAPSDPVADNSINVDTELVAGNKQQTGFENTTTTGIINNAGVDGSYTRSS